MLKRDLGGPATGNALAVVAVTFVLLGALSEATYLVLLFGSYFWLGLAVVTVLLAIYVKAERRG